MPETIEPVKHASNPIKLHTGETPRTTFINMEQALRVELITSHVPMEAMGEMVQAPQSATPQIGTADERTQHTLEGNGMWMLEEIPTFTFRISGVSRILTHQLVRQRIGVTFMQQCTGDVDFRHCNIIVPGAVAVYPATLEIFIQACLHAKAEYAYLLDRGVSLHSARYLLPQGIETFIYMQAPLVTVRSLYQKRCCTMTQAWEMVLFAERMKEAVLREYPFLVLYLTNPCLSGKCWYHKVRATGVEPPLWYPDEAHDLFDWNAANYMYPGTNKELSSPEETNLPRAYVGYNRA